MAGSLTLDSIVSPLVLSISPSACWYWQHLLKSEHSGSGFFALFKQSGNSGRHSGEGESCMGVRCWCSYAKSPLWIKHWATGPRDDNNPPRVWGAYWLERDKAHSGTRTGGGQSSSKQHQHRDWGADSLPWGGATQHLPPQGTQETQGRTRVLLQIIINTEMLWALERVSAKHRLWPETQEHAQHALWWAHLG